MFDPNTRIQNLLLRARAEWLGRQQGRRQPTGKRYNGLWHPARNESRPCCVEYLRGKQYGLTDMYEHCCTLEHVAQLYGVGVEELERVIGVMQKENR